MGTAAPGGSGVGGGGRGRRARDAARILALAVGFAALGPTASPLDAQAPETTEDTTGVAPRDTTERPVRTVPSIRVDATLPEDIRRTPGAAATLSHREIDDLRPYTLHDAFGFVAGVRTIYDDVLGRRSGIGIRGAPTRRSRKTLLLEDGVPVNAATYLDPSGHYTPPMERLERVDVLKGAGQIVHGPLNNYGVVNFRNKQPTREPETTAGVAVGNQSTIERHLMHRRTEGPVGMVLSYTGTDADGAFDVEETSFNDVYASADWRVGDRHDLGASLTYFRERSSYDENNLSPDEFAANPRSKRVLGEGREFNNISVDYLKADLTHDVQVTERLSVSTKLFATELDRPRFRTDGTPPPDGGVMEGRDRHYRSFGGRTHLELAALEALGTTHTLQAGIRHERQLFDDKRPVGRPGEVLDAGDRGNVFAVAGEDGYTDDGRFTEFRASAVSGFVQDAVQVGDWTFTPGLRIERFTQEKRETFRPGSELADESSESTVVLPGVSVLYSGLRETELYGGVHRGYAPAIARTTDFPLRPETGVNGQFGVRSEIVRGVRADVSGFLSFIQGTLVKEDFTDEFGDNVFINSADSEALGVDVALEADSEAWIESSLVLSGRLAYSFAEATFSEGPLDGNRVPEIPLHSGSLTVEVEHTSGPALGLTASHFGHFYADRANTRTLGEDVGRVPARTLFSGRVRHDPPGTPVSFYLQGRNLTDKLFVTDVQDGLRPGPGRTVVGGLEVTF